jgi:hypothetical protein
MSWQLRHAPRPGHDPSHKTSVTGHYAVTGPRVHDEPGQLREQPDSLYFSPETKGIDNGSSLAQRAIKGSPSYYSQATNTFATL